MPIPVEDFTPRQLVEQLDQYIVGQQAAKKAVAVALRNRYRRQQLSPEERDDVLPKNILMIGPTGVGKTEIARRLAQIARAPFIKIEATKFTEVGYVGRDVESMVRDLVSVAVRLVEQERTAAARAQIEEQVIDRLVDLVDELDHPRIYSSYWPASEEDEPEAEEPSEAEVAERKKKLREEILSGKHDQRVVEVDTDEASNPFVQVFTNQGIEEMGLEGQFGGAFGSKRVTRRVTVVEAREILFVEESKRVIDQTGVFREAVVRAEQTGIIFLDEIDKIAVRSGGAGPDVSREGVQRDLLPIIEGSTVATKFGPVRTDHILFIAAGAFHMSKPSELIPELQGRLPIRVELEPLTRDDFRRILLEPRNALTKQYRLLLKTEGVDVEFTEDALNELAFMAAQVNERSENIGARRLHTLMEKLLEDILYDAPDCGALSIKFDAQMVRTKLEESVRNADKSRFIL